MTTMALPSKETRRVVKGPHLWVITVLMAILIVGYYSNYVDISSWIPFGKQFFTAEYARDLHRALFLIPRLYAAIVFHLRGAFVVSFIFFLVVTCLTVAYAAGWYIP